MSSPEREMSRKTNLIAGLLKKNLRLTVEDSVAVAWQILDALERMDDKGPVTIKVSKDE